MFRLPPPSSPYEQQTLTLEGETFVFVTRLNSRNGNFYLDILKNNELLISSVLILTDELSLNQYVLDEFTGGDVQFTELTIAEDGPDLENIQNGGDYNFVYFTAFETEARNDI